MEKKKLDVMIIGSQKAGTSSLLVLGAQHPEVIGQDLSGEFTYFLKDEEYKNGYEANFKKHFDRLETDKTYLAKNVGILESAKALKRLKEHNQDIKIVAMLRNPVDRAYSAFWYMKSRGAEPAKRFKDIVYLDVKNRFPNDEFRQRNCDYIGKGFYYKWLNQLHDIFPKEQILLINFDEFKQNPQRQLDRMFEFIGLDGFEINNNVANKTYMPKSEALAKVYSRQTWYRSLVGKIVPLEMKTKIRKALVRLNKTEKKIPPLEESLRNDLKLKFKEDNQKLAEKYGIDFS